MRASLTSLTIGVLLLGAMPPAMAAAPVNPDCKPKPGAAVRGEAAVAELGARLPDAARSAGMSTAEFARHLRHDRTLWVDSCARAFYVEPVAEVKSTATGKPAPSSILDPSGNALTLQSRPGAARTIYLDFDGQSINGTAWNASWTSGASWNAPAYSVDADPAFNATELNEIRNVWLRVAEDYAPFDINVTTQDPGVDAITRSSSTDTVYGTRVLITNDTVGYNSCGCGGVAYVGTVDITSNHAYYQPAWVFTKGVGTGAKSVAEAASHEAGHNFGLSHDGTVAHDSVAAAGYYSGHGAWAPIMGIGYYKPLSQWSVGEYSYASQKQDDFAVMGQNGAVLVRDDHGDSAATATATAGSASGLIGTRTDTDWFSFTASGATTIRVTPQATGANLDARLDIYNSAGTLVAGADPAVAMVSASTAAGLDASITTTLAAGTYYARVDGTGWGDVLGTGYSDYGSVGRYALNVTTVTDPLRITTASLPSATAGTAYSQTLAASGGRSPYTWAVTSGSLPAGLTLSGATISGTPTTAGTSTFTVRVTDASGATANTTFTVTVAPKVTPLTITTTTLPAGKLRTAYRATLLAGGGTSPYTWSRVSGSLPAGLSLSSSGVLSGTPTKAATYSFTLQVRDSLGATAQRTYSVSIAR